MSDTATAPKKAKAATEKQWANPLALAGKPKQVTIPLKSLTMYRELQARTDTSGGQIVDEDRVAQMRDAMLALLDAKADPLAFEPKVVKGLKQFPPIKVMVVKDAKGQEVHVVWDGMHTTHACEYAKVKEIPCLVWEGTSAQALAAAATVANREHETNGKPLSNKDKIHSVKMMAKAITLSGIPKKDYPSNRELGRLVGVSHTLVGELDPFERRQEGSKTREEVQAGKRVAAAASKAPPPKPLVGGWADGTPAPYNPPENLYSVVNKSAGGTVHQIEAKSQDDAEKRFKAEKPAWEHSAYVVKPAKDAPPPVKSEQVAAGHAANPGALFDWSGVEGHLGYLIRGTSAASEIYGIEKEAKAEYQRVIVALDTIARQFKEWRTKYSVPKKKTEAKQEAKPDAK